MLELMKGKVPKNFFEVESIYKEFNPNGAKYFRGISTEEIFYKVKNDQL